MKGQHLHHTAVPGPAVKIKKVLTAFLPLVLLIFLTSCATLHQNYTKDDLLAYTADYEEKIISHHLPIFIVENPNDKHNLIGTPSARDMGNSKEEIYISHETPTIYAETRTFTGEIDSYTNVIYRIHFEKIPFSLLPFYLSYGKNVGLLVVVTLNSNEEPVLYTTVHTCGCYLAFVPTSYMEQDAYPENWDKKHQAVYGEVLPGLLDLQDASPLETNTAILIRNNTHRVKDIYLASRDTLMNYQTAAADIQPLDSLNNISLDSKRATTFYETSGRSSGYVKGSHKVWEKLLISWWAIDWRVGEDKKLGKTKGDGPIFYTSLKPWARTESDMRFFPAFLRYWGWNL